MERPQTDQNKKPQDDFSHLVNPDDAMEVQREQEVKPARTTTGPGETSVPKANADKDLGAHESKAPAPDEGAV